MWRKWPKKKRLNIFFFFFSACTDSDTGFLEDKSNKPKRKHNRKRTTNLGPRLKVLNINPIESDPAGIKVECQMETAKQKTINFEFSTVDFAPEDMSNEFVKEDLLPQDHREILIKQLNDIVKQLEEDSSKIPIVHFPPEPTTSSSSPSRESAKKHSIGTTSGSGGVPESTGSSSAATAGTTTTASGSAEQHQPSSAPSSPGRKLEFTTQESQTEVKKFKRFEVTPIGFEVTQVIPSVPHPISETPTAQGTTSGDQTATTPNTGMTPESTIHQQNKNYPMSVEK